MKCSKLKWRREKKTCWACATNRPFECIDGPASITSSMVLAMLEANGPPTPAGLLVVAQSQISSITDAIGVILCWLVILPWMQVRPVTVNGVLLPETWKCKTFISFKTARAILCSSSRHLSLPQGLVTLCKLATPWESLPFPHLPLSMQGRQAGWKQQSRGSDGPRLRTRRMLFESQRAGTFGKTG
jgi:hypothetical protein